LAAVFVLLGKAQGVTSTSRSALAENPARRKSAILAPSLFVLLLQGLSFSGIELAWAAKLGAVLTISHRSSPDLICLASVDCGH
jgi:hypothetical protein